MKVYYIPIVGVQWHLLFWVNRKNEWGWTRDMTAEMDKNGQTVAICNSLISWRPMYFLVGSSEIAEYFKREADIAIKKSLQTKPVVPLGFFYKHTAKDLHMRGVFAQVFEAKNLSKISPRVQEICRVNLEKLKANIFKNGSSERVDVDLVPTIDQIFRDLLDMILFGESEDRIDGQTLTAAMARIVQEGISYEFDLENLGTFGLLRDLNLSPKIRCMRRRYELIKASINKRYKNVCAQEIKENSFLGNVAAYNIENPGSQISTEDIVGSCALLVFASYDTTRHSSNWAVNFLKENQTIQESVYQEIKNLDLERNQEEIEKLESNEMLDKFVKETLRLGSPFMASDIKQFVKKCKIGKFVFQKGDMIFVGLGMSSAKESKFKNALSFDPERFDKENKRTWDRMDYIPFSSGRRQCIGQYMALMNLKIVVKEILKAFKLEDDPSFDREVGDFLVHVRRNALVKLSPRIVNEE